MAPKYDDVSDFYDPETGAVHLPPGHRARIIEIEPVEVDDDLPDDEVEDPTGDHDDWDDE